MVWSEIGKWILILVLLLIVIIAVINPVREAMFAKIDEIFNFIRFG